MALLIGAIGYWAVTDDGEDSADTADAPTTTPDTESPDGAPDEPPATSTTEPPAVDEAGFVALVRDLQDYVEQARGLTFTRDVVVELADDAAFEKRLLEDFEEDIDEIEDVEVFYRALGLLETAEPLVDVLREIYAQGVLGFYDTETDELVVRGRSATPYVQQTIVHELVHALDDQHFELFRPTYDDRDDEVPVGFGAVVEGNARRVENDWLADQPAAVQDQAAAEEARFAEGIDIDDFPYVLIFGIAAPYEFGELFVDHLVGGQGERAVDEALTTPPDTSEQFLFPDVYDARQPRVPVPAPPADGDVIDEGAFGALLLFGMLTDPDVGIDPVTATVAADGWGGDWYVTWTDGDANCVRADFVGDDDDDTDEIASALQEWVDARSIGVVTEVDGRVRLESCTVGGGAASQV